MKITSKEAIKKLEESGVEGADILLSTTGTKEYVDWCTYLLDTYIELGKDLIRIGQKEQAEENERTVIIPLKTQIKLLSKR